MMVEQEVLTRTGSTAEAARTLVHRRLGDDDDSWNLALVQRAEVWDQVRMRHLLDSLLAGYPIGAILLCRVKETSRSIRTKGAERFVEDTEPGAWQLVDGQQRINALVSMLTEHGRYGVFYLHMTESQQRPGAAATRKSKDAAVRYIHWQQDREAPMDQRELRIDLTRWAGWTEKCLDAETTFDSDNVVAALRDLDPEFTDSLSPADAVIAADRLTALTRAWFQPSVPVLRAEVESPLDVLEVFARINLGGVQVAGIDVYFAAVKTFWTEAEEHLARVEEAAPLLGRRMGALRFMSRLAGRGLGYGDPLPLNVDRLTGPTGESLRLAMQELTARDAIALRRIEAFSAWMQHHSELGFVLHLVTPELWDEVLAWAAASERADEDWYATNQPVIDAYLVGATLFRYRQTLRERFQRLALLEALSAGANGQMFPIERITAVARVNDGLRGGRRSVPTLREDRQQIADNNGTLLTTLAQRIEYQSEDQVDWDHIFPGAEAKRMWSPGMGGRRRHHRNRWMVNSAGNLWALRASTNRSLQATPPTEKFALLRRWDADSDSREHVWERARWSLTDQEIDDFIRVDELLDDVPARIDQGMEIFASLVRSRTGRLLESAFERFPQARLFDPDADVLPIDGSDVRGFATELGLSDLVARQKQQKARGASAVLTTGWGDRCEELRHVVQLVVKALTVGPRALPTKPWPGFEFAGYVYFPVDGEERSVAAGVADESISDGSTPFWVHLNAGHYHFDDSVRRLEASQFAGSIRYRATAQGQMAHAWIPLAAEPALQRYELADHLIPQARAVLESVADSG